MAKEQTKKQRAAARKRRDEHAGKTSFNALGVAVLATGVHAVASASTAAAADCAAVVNSNLCCVDSSTGVTGCCDGTPMVVNGDCGPGGRGCPTASANTGNFKDVDCPPTAAPTVTPTAAPTATPTLQPSKAPTTAPSAAPTVAPTASPTSAPVVAPTTQHPDFTRPDVRTIADNPSGQPGTSPGVIAAAVAGPVALLLLVAVCAYVVYRRSNNTEDAGQAAAAAEAGAVAADAVALSAVPVAVTGGATVGGGDEDNYMAVPQRVRDGDGVDMNITGGAPATAALVGAARASGGEYGNTGLAQTSHAYDDARGGAAAAATPFPASGVYGGPSVAPGGAEAAVYSAPATGAGGAASAAYETVTDAIGTGGSQYNRPPQTAVQREAARQAAATYDAAHAPM